jgi:epoxyqueuosine reductase
VSAKSLIQEIAWDLGIDGIGICDAQPLSGTREAFEDAVREGLIPEESAPRPNTITRLTAPRRHLQTAKSVISAFEYYHTGAGPCNEPSHGAVAPYTRANYYLDLKLRLKRLGGFMESEFMCRTKAFSCYVTLAEKPLAQKAGIGFYGKNGVIITPTYGSFVVLGEIVTNLELEPDDPLGEDCGTCEKCIEACPTGAITSPGKINRSKCIQYLSERRGTIPRAIREIWSNRLYGCSTCQEVCPRNSGLSPSRRQVSWGRVGDCIPLEEVIKMDGDGFQKRFANNQIGMRETNAIRRNAVVAAGNSGLETFLPTLTECACEPDPMMRQHSLWAIARILGQASRNILARALAVERDPQVWAETKSLLDALGAGD